MQCPQAMLFDLDDTLAPHLQPVAPAMLQRLLQLVQLMPIAIVTGRDLSRIQTETLSALASSPHASRVYIFPSGSTQGYHCESGQWVRFYAAELSDSDKQTIRTAIEQAVVKTGALEGLPVYGERYVDKGSMLSFAMLGVPLPADVDRTWDPGNARRSALWRSIAQRLPEYDVLMGGVTAIDISRKGVNKSFSVHWLSTELGIPPKDMLFVGDGLFEGGNDAVVVPTGIATRPVTGPEETAGVIDEVLTSCRAQA